MVHEYMNCTSIPLYPKLAQHIRVLWMKRNFENQCTNIVSSHLSTLTTIYGGYEGIRVSKFVSMKSLNWFGMFYYIWPCRAKLTTLWCIPEVLWFFVGIVVHICQYSRWWSVHLAAQLELHVSIMEHFGRRYASWRYISQLEFTTDPLIKCV